jgi:hypothetical protein
MLKGSLISLTALVLPKALAQASDEMPREENDDGYFVFRSGYGSYTPFLHTHTINVPKQYFVHPPNHTVWIPTSIALLHFHYVGLNPDDFIALTDGREIVVPDNIFDHYYTMQIKWASSPEVELASRP